MNLAWDRAIDEARTFGGKLRCTGATWSDAVVILQPQAHALRAPAPGTVVETPPAAAPDPGEDDFEGGRMSRRCRAHRRRQAAARLGTTPFGPLSYKGGFGTPPISVRTISTAPPEGVGRHPISARTIRRPLPTRGVGTPRSDEDDFEADKLTLTIERIRGGKLRCTSWDDAVVIMPGEALAFVNLARPAHALQLRVGTSGVGMIPPWWLRSAGRSCSGVVDHGLEPIAAIDEASAQAEREVSVWRAKSQRKCRRPYVRTREQHLARKMRLQKLARNAPKARRLHPLKLALGLGQMAASQRKGLIPQGTQQADQEDEDLLSQPSGLPQASSSVLAPRLETLPVGELHGAVEVFLEPPAVVGEGQRRLVWRTAEWCCAFATRRGRCPFRRRRRRSAARSCRRPQAFRRRDRARCSGCWSTCRISPRAAQALGRRRTPCLY
jgi:hypothetical protein